MAAIICQGMTKCCDFFCSLPCKVCGTGCRAMSSPVSAFVITTVLLQLPIVILSGMDFNSSAFGFGTESGSCKGADWLIGMFIVSVISILISFYLSFRVTNTTDITLRDNNRHTSYERISYLLCHDPIIAFYILVWLFFIAWLIVGSFWSMTNQMDNDSDTTNIDSRCNTEIESNVGIVLGLGWTYLIVGPTVLSCVLCCACFSERDYVASDAEFAAMAAKANNNNNNNDIEMANLSSPPTQTQQLPLPTTGKLESKTSVHSNNHNSSSYITTDTKNTPPRTYSVEGIPIDEVKNNNNNRTSYVAEKQQQAPPPNSSDNKIPEVMAEEIPPPMLPPATAPRTTTTTAVDSVTNTIGGWFKGGKSSNKKDGPEMKATVY